MPPLAWIGAALCSALIHASWNAALKGGRGDRITDSFLIAVGGVAVWIAIWLTLGPPPTRALPYLALSVAIHLLYWITLFKKLRRRRHEPYLHALARLGAGAGGVRRRAHGA